jgi:hypothetical protein
MGKIAKNLPFFDKTKFADEMWVAMIKEDISIIGEGKEAQMFEFMKKYAAQKKLSTQQTLEVLLENERIIKSMQNFDATPYVKEILIMLRKRKFSKYRDKDNRLDIEAYLDDKGLMELEKMAIAEELKYFTDRYSPANLKKSLIPAFVIFGVAVVLTFLTPNFLQKMHILPASTSWLLKILVGIVCFFIYFKIANRLFGFWMEKKIGQNDIQ